MTREQLWALRGQIPLCSLFYSDYRNTFGIGCHAVCDFFDGYADNLVELMNEDKPGRGDNHFFDHLNEYDCPDNLWNWYGCFEEDPLPFPANDEEAC